MRPQPVSRHWPSSSKRNPPTPHQYTRELRRLPDLSHLAPRNSRTKRSDSGQSSRPDHDRALVRVGAFGLARRSNPCYSGRSFDGCRPWPECCLTPEGADRRLPRAGSWGILDPSGGRQRVGRLSACAKRALSIGGRRVPIRGARRSRAHLGPGRGAARRRPISPTSATSLSVRRLRLTKTQRQGRTGSAATDAAVIRTTSSAAGSEFAIGSTPCLPRAATG